MRVRSARLATTVAFATIAGACSSSSLGPSGTGGSSGAGTGGGGGGVTCPAGTACGGSVVGTWNVTASCLSISGDLDIGLVGAGCPTTPVTGSLQVTGTFTANADGTYSDGTTTSGAEQFPLAAACLTISSTPVTCDGAANFIKNLGFASLTCTSTSNGGCACSGTVQQSGSLGVVSVAPTTSGSYTPSGNQVTIAGDVGDTTYATCVEIGRAHV